MIDGLYYISNLILYYPEELVISLCIVISFHYIIFRKTSVMDIFDPLFATLGFNLCAMTMIIWLYMTDSYINVDTIRSYLLMNVLLLLFLKIFIRRADKTRIINIRAHKDNKANENYFYKIYCYIYFFIFTIVLIKYGVLFQNFSSHLEAGHVIGLPLTIIGQMIPVLSFLTICRIMRGKFDAYIVLLLLFTSVIIWGRKSHILHIGSALFFYKLYCLKFDINLSKKYLFLKKSLLFLIVFGCVLSFVIMLSSFQSSGDDRGVLGLMLFRLVSSGDIYAYIIPNGLESTLEKINAFDVLVSPSLKVLKLIPADTYDVSVGQYIWQLFHPGLVGGPNPRFDVLFFAFWGEYIGYAFSILLAGIIAFWIRYVYKRICGFGLPFFLIYISIYINLVSFITNPASIKELVLNLIINGTLISVGLGIRSIYK